jgi:pimeloyl-ACP methyl ester carboxylesterase
MVLHGRSRAPPLFYKQLEQLTLARRVLALDLRGHGDSKRPVLVGWSMGAFVAWDYVSQFGTGALSGGDGHGQREPTHADRMRGSLRARVDQRHLSGVGVEHDGGARARGERDGNGV